jgi:serine protein kinase
MLGFIDETRKDYDEMAKKRSSAPSSTPTSNPPRRSLDNYLDNVDAYCNRTKVKDPITGDDVDADERLMRSIEEQIGVSENAKREFREGIMRSVASVSRRGGSFGVGSDERLKEAPGKETLRRPERRRQDHHQHQNARRRADEEDQRGRRAARGDHGYCPTCANELLKYVGTLLNR